MFDIGKRGQGADSERQSTELPEVDQGVEMPRQKPASGGVRSREAAVVGPSIHIEGTLRGEEDLIIEGHVKGTIQLQGNCLTIGSNGHVDADLHAHTIFVDGRVEGDLYGAERVAIRASADVRGNVTAPRVSLEDGARFKGAIEMESQAPGARETVSTSPGASAAKPQQKAEQATRQTPPEGAPSPAASKPGPDDTSASGGDSGRAKDTKKAGGDRS